MLGDILYVILGLVLIIVGGGWFVAAAVRLAEYLRMPRVVIGSTLVSLATTSPELTVSIMAGVRGESELAVGNAIGSCICNIALILGVTAAIKQVNVHPRALTMPLAFMFAAGMLLFILTFNLSLGKRQGFLLLGCGLAYFAWDFWRHWRDRNSNDLEEAQAIVPPLEANPSAWFDTRAGTTVQFILGALVVVFGSRLLVDGAASAATRLGVPSMVIGLTLVAVGTSLPELVTAIHSSRQSASDLSVGNVLGANIANLTLIIGATAIIQDVAMSRLTQLYNFPALLIIMGLLLWLLLAHHCVTRRQGAVLLAVYGLYLSGLVTLTLWAR